MPQRDWKVPWDVYCGPSCCCSGTPSRLILDRNGAALCAHPCCVEGDVDFNFGRATAVIDKAIIKSLAAASTPGGYVTAPSTSAHNAYGFLITRSRFISNAERDTVFLGRPWHPSSGPDNDPQIVIRQSWLGQHVITGNDGWAPQRNRSN